MNKREEREMWRSVKAKRDKADYLARKEAKAARLIAKAEAEEAARLAEVERQAARIREREEARERAREEHKAWMEREAARRAELAANPPPPPAPRPSRPLTRAEALFLLPLLMVGS